MGREEGGGFRTGNTCIPVADKDLKIIKTSICVQEETNIYINVSKNTIWFNVLEAIKQHVSKVYTI